MLITLGVIFVGALLAPIFSIVLKGKEGVSLSIVSGAAFVYFFTFYDDIRDGEVIVSTYSWINELGLSISFYLDGLSLLFCLLVLGIGTLILIYSNGYMLTHHHKGRFYSFMMLFLGSMLGLVTAGNLISLYIFWELTTISSYLLIGFYNHKEDSRKAALQALLITAFGGLALLSAIVIIGGVLGGFEVAYLLSNPDILKSHPSYTAIMVLVLIGTFTKSAQFPFHFWLPGAMKAPTPVSAFLHSATMVKAGIYLLARLHPVLGNTIFWNNSLAIFGAISMFMGAYFALTKKDLKSILAYTTINALGVLVMLIGTGTVTAMKAMLLYLVIHAFYKASLFMIAGEIEEKTGTRNIYKLGNLRKEMPVTTVVSILILLSMAGLPPMLGYVSKEFIYDAKLKASSLAYSVLVLNVISNILMLSISAILAYQVFFRKKRRLPDKIKEGGVSFWFGPMIMAFLSLVLALFPGEFEPLLEYSFQSVKDQFAEIHIKLWHGFTEEFWLSLLTVFAGLLVFLFRQKFLHALMKINSKVFHIHFADVFSSIIDAVMQFAKKKTRFLQHGYHRYYLMVILLISSFLLLFQIQKIWTWDYVSNLASVYFFTAGIAAIIIFSAFAAVVSRTKLTAIITMGIVGYGLAMVYMIYEAIDLAITQILVETLILVIFVMVVYKLPDFAKFSSRWAAIRDGIIAGIAGIVMTAIALESANVKPLEKVSEFFVENSLSRAHGKNIVNVILVDFRSMDTLGEITVLAIAAFGAFALLKLKRKKNYKKER